MKTQYQFIHFEKTDAGSEKHPIWSCINNRAGDELGEVKWYAPWQQYCYFPSCPANYSAGCLADIQAFINDITKETKS